MTRKKGALKSFVSIWRIFWHSEERDDIQTNFKSAAFVSTKGKFFSNFVSQCCFAVSYF